MNGQVYFHILEIIFTYMCCIFILAQLLKNNSIVDIFWGLGFVTITAYFIFFGTASSTASFVLMPCHLVNACVIVWGSRLSSYIFIRNRGKGEDWRYVNFRKAWGKHPFAGAFFQVFMLQGLFMLIISLPVIHVNTYFSSINYLTYAGFVLWMIGFFFEAVGDYQLMQFKKQTQNKGRTMRYGLWKYTRHPNYFGEILMWWAIWIMTINFFTPLQTLIGLLSPLTISWLLTRVSGVPLLEKKYRDNPEYRDYIDHTPAVFPDFRKN